MPLEIGSARQREGAAEEAGVGLGLALVRQIAEYHGGTAVCRARDGGGLVFEVTLRGVAPNGTRPEQLGREHLRS